MRVTEPLGIAAARTLLPPRRQTAVEAVAAGLIREQDVQWEEWTEVAIGTVPAISALAAPAARATLEAAGLAPLALDILVYAWTTDQRPEAITPANRLARLIGADRALAYGIQQMCNGGAAGLHTSVGLLLTEPRVDSALVVAADVFSGLPYDRWTGSRGTLLGDGAAAACLVRGPAPLALRSIATASVNAAEDVFPGYDPFGALDPAADHKPPAWPRDLLVLIRNCVRGVVRDALDDAGLAPDDSRIHLVSGARLGRTLTRALLRPGFPPGLPPPTRLGTRTGHLGAGDLLANLAHCEQALPPGRFAVLATIGAGFNATCLVVEAV
ncbi:hypothetical protein ACF07U_15075 [Streptomyces californicus]|uniref:hypothetical protein n=1 Tax=Streptomyces californicus TaxID=67351 RepID=UPI0036FA97FA